MDGGAFVPGTEITSEGPHRLYVRAADLAGNAAEQAVAFEVRSRRRTLYATFDHSTDADEAGGSHKELDGAKITHGGKGYEGEGLKNNYNGKNAARYAGPGNVDLSRGTLCTWVLPEFTKAVQGGEDRGRYVFRAAGGGGEERSQSEVSLAVYGSGGTSLKVVGSDGATYVLCVDSGPEEQRWYADGSWTHLAVTWDAGVGSLRIYINGELAGQKQVDPWAVDPAENVLLGAGPITKTGLHGTLDLVSVYDTELSKEQVRHRYEEETPPLTTAALGDTIRP
jgi:hypothetical protein